MKSKWVWLAVLVLVLVVADAKPSSAQDGCFVNFDRCIYEAAASSSYWYAFLRTLDCELDLIECLREKLTGW